MLVSSFLENSAAKSPDRDAVWYKDVWMTYGEIDVRANRLGNYLKERGIHRGDRVAILYENSFDYIVAYYAILKAGGVTVALNTDPTAEALVYTLNHSGARAIVTNGRYSRYLVPALRRVPDLTEVITEQEDLSEYEEIGHCSQVRLGEILEH